MKLLFEPFFVNCKDENGFSGLYYAARGNCLVVLEYLLNRENRISAV